MNPNENALVEQGVGQNKNHCTYILNDQSVAVKHFSYPDASCVKGRVLGALLRGEHLTHWDCWKRFGSARLSHHIYILRGVGWRIKMDERIVTTSDAGRPATIGVYYFDPEVITLAGEDGQRYAEECARIEVEHRAIGRGV